MSGADPKASPEARIVVAHPTAWWLALAGALTAMGLGAYCFVQQLTHGDIITNMGTPGYGGAAWGLYIAFVIYFVGVSFAGITVSALARLFGIEALKPATRAAELLTIVALIAGATAILSDLGRPLAGLMLLPKFARPQSPFYGTFTLVIAGYMFSSVVYFFLSARQDAAAMARSGPRRLRWFYRAWASGCRDTTAEHARHHRASYWLSVTILPLLVTAHSTLGFIFGIQSGRPGWYSALQAPGFVVLAGVSGTGMVILLLLGIRWMFGLAQQIPAATIRWLGALMSVLALVYLYFMIVEELTATYAAPPIDQRVAHAITAGVFAPGFWTTVACLAAAFAIPFILYLRGRTSLAWLGTAAALANVAAVCKRMLIVVPSQTHGTMISVEHGYYLPNHIEIGLVGGLFGLVVAAILVFGRIFPLTPSAPTPRAEPAAADDTARRRALRLIATGFTMTVALTLIAFGLADSFRLFSGGEIDPRVPFSPVIFATGVMVLFSSAIVYEVFPGRATRRNPTRDRR
ncbi:MAG TPA: NrfD/PsrC family molybdoenzyme membrane anchor subunit [Kofleriaceae bacterium]|nr:NrfD/PsrC family molybdoenzyme membrane anchor subunit [Kofleriaceae bacterium]